MANSGGKTWQSFEELSRQRWGREFSASEYPSTDSLQLGAIQRAAKALEQLCEQFAATSVLVARLALALERIEDAPAPAEANAKRQKAEREKASRVRAMAAYIRAGGTAALFAAGDDAAPADADLVMRKLSVRARNVLNRLGCKTLADLAERTADEVFEQRNCGQTTVDELRRALARVGLAFAGEQ